MVSHAKPTEIEKARSANISGQQIKIPINKCILIRLDCMDAF